MSNLSKVQSWLNINSIDFFILPRTDEFLNEYISPNSERLKWVSNFTGSAGIAIIMKNNAAIFIDGRYTIQAKKEVDTKKFSIISLYNFENWLKKNLKKKYTISLDPKLHSIKNIESIKRIINKKGARIKFLKKNPIDILWEKQPRMPITKSFTHNLKYSGKSTQQKISQIKFLLKKNKCNYYLFTNIDSIAWLLNLRGNDIKYTPLNFAYALITPNKKIELFINKHKIINIKSKLKKFANLHSLKSINNFIINIPIKYNIGMDKNRTPFIFKNILKDNIKKIKYFNDPCLYPKAQKNNIELNGARNANIRDGISITKFLYWLKNTKKISKISEIQASKKIFSLRKKNKLFYSLSFKTISAFGKNSALPHYNLLKNSNLKFKPNNIYLIDSGAQYLDGTTDITRTIIIGNSNKEQRDRFTRVLKGHIALATRNFKNNTTSFFLDSLARKSLKEIGCDYEHGTGHGIGNFLSVHEGPQMLGKNKRRNNNYLKEGMILSNEPGYYKKNKYGIRIENLLITRKKSKYNYNFETISWAPIDIELIEPSLLTFKEINWLNWYHQQVYYKLSYKLKNNEKNWLYKVTRPIKR